MALDNFNGGVSIPLNWNAAQLIALGSNYEPVTNNGSVSPSYTYTVGAGVQQANACYSNGLSIAPSGNATIDLTSFTDVLGQAASFSKVKSIQINLVSVAQDDVNGTDCDFISIGAGSTPAPLFFGDVTYTANIGNGMVLTYGNDDAAGFPVTGGANNLTITNGDGAIAAFVLVTIIGAE